MTTENARRFVGTTIEITWGTSRGRDTYGYTVCSLRYNGRLIARCNGGGYDMRGTVIGNFVTWAFGPELRALKPEDMPMQSEYRETHRYCGDKCLDAWRELVLQAIADDKPEPAPLPELSTDCRTCPVCQGYTRAQGERVETGRSFYGLRFIDPNYDPSKAVIGQDCSDCTLADGSEGMTVAEAEAKGVSFGLERLQAAYKATAPHATERHTIPTIDGACGMSSVERILRAIGIGLHQVVNKSKLDVYEIVALETEAAVAA
jgi:hypothetical protein